METVLGKSEIETLMASAEDLSNKESFDRLRGHWRFSMTRQVHFATAINLSHDAQACCLAHAMSHSAQHCPRRCLNLWMLPGKQFATVGIRAQLSYHIPDNIRRIE